jgi:glycosyltransferase involved in cell wall biosynthesis
MNVMIFQPEARGHHMILYLRHIAREVVRRGWNLHLVTTREATEHPAYGVVQGESGARMKTSIIPDARYPRANPAAHNLLAFQFRQHRTFAAAYRRLAVDERPDVVFVENLDHCDKALSLLGSPFGDTPLVALLMAVRFHHRRMAVQGATTRQDRVYEWLFRRILAVDTLRSLAVIDEALVEYAQQGGYTGLDKVRFVPDAASLSGSESREAARQLVGLRPEQLGVLVYGGLSERKGLDALLAAGADAQCPQHVVLVLAGAQDAKVQGLLAGPDAQRLRAQGRLIELPYFLDDAAEYRVFRAADVVWLGYRGFPGMSGVLVQAATMGLPIVACREGIIGWVTARYGVGEIVDVARGSEVLSALARLAADPALRTAYGTNGQRMAERHAPERFGGAIADALAEASLVNGAPTPSLRSAQHA